MALDLTLLKKKVILIEKIYGDGSRVRFEATANPMILASRGLPINGIFSLTSGKKLSEEELSKGDYVVVDDNVNELSDLDKYLSGGIVL